MDILQYIEVMMLTTLLFLPTLIGFYLFIEWFAKKVKKQEKKKK